MHTIGTIYCAVHIVRAGMTKFGQPSPTRGIASISNISPKGGLQLGASRGGTIFTEGGHFSLVNFVLGEHYSPVNIVQGDTIHR